MSFVLSLEIDTCLSKKEFIEAALACGAVSASDGEEEVSMIFPRSGLQVFLRTSFDLPHVLAEGLEKPVLWDVGMRASLAYVIDKYDDCNFDVRRLMERLEASSSSNFVLSFQYETVYAIRDEDGLHFFQ